MKRYFSLKIDNAQHSITPESGVSADVIAKLIRDLYGATEIEEESDMTLFAINNTGYTPKFVTNSDRRYDQFVKVHKNIVERGIEDLRWEEAKYAKTIKRLLKGGLFLEPYDENNKKITTVYPNQIKERVQGYFSTTTITGIVSQLGPKSLDKDPYIFLDRYDYKIFVSKEQAFQLREYIRENRLAFKIRQKRSIKHNKVVSAALLSFRPMSNHSLIENLASLDDLDFLKDINNQDDLLNYLGK